MDDVPRLRRIECSFLAWLAGQGTLVLIVFLLCRFAGSHSGWLDSLDMAVTYLMFSLLIGFPGWALVGLPVALFWPASLLRKYPYSVVALFGVVAGPFIVWLVLACDALVHSEGIFRYLSNSGLFFFCSAIVSAVCCLVYRFLLRTVPVSSQTAARTETL